ncbi:uncharacterized protein BDR25DRAFT_331930 [Lindgomyces ingoldianus]|uniref:Uncharacterized protein n=1 Tax=Lindgomyces ingoldianus TaxID=673940 RepID=A0ACB6RB58_9PLEO|nr:uncharacterized protein BDR25DRAFT_331930 [Lindgomyces ingoldianus]KAF2475580.1 hypothetical protein BDR25DRAFT_331930 [Lindgomyces ingoldianus]
MAYKFAQTIVWTRTIKSGVTPTVTAISTTTYARTYYDLQVVSVFYPPNAVGDSDLQPTTTTGQTTDVFFYMPVVYTAPTTCSSSFEFTTTELVFIPSEVTDQVTATSKKTATTTGYGGGVTETWYLSQSAVPFTTSTEYYYTAYVSRCSKPYQYTYNSYYPSSTARSGGGNGGYSYTYCYGYGGCTSLKVWVIIIATLLPSLFVLGFIESYFWFRRLMTGQGCLRFGTISWICISLWVACFTRSQSARSKEDQKMLREQWKNMGGWTRFKLWWKWGFRHSYPVSLLGQYSRNTVGYLPAQTGQNGGIPPPNGGVPPNGGMPPMTGMPQGYVQQPYMQQPYSMQGVPQPYPPPGMMPYQQQPYQNPLMPGQQPYPSPSPVSQQSAEAEGKPAPTVSEVASTPQAALGEVSEVASTPRAAPAEVSEVASTPQAPVSEVESTPRGAVSEVGSPAPTQPSEVESKPPGGHPNPGT